FVGASPLPLTAVPRTTTLVPVIDQHASLYDGMQAAQGQVGQILHVHPQVQVSTPLPRRSPPGLDEPEAVPDAVLEANKNPLTLVQQTAAQPHSSPLVGTLGVTGSVMTKEFFKPRMPVVQSPGDEIQNALLNTVSEEKEDGQEAQVQVLEAVETPSLQQLRSSLSPVQHPDNFNIAPPAPNWSPLVAWAGLDDDGEKTEVEGDSRTNESIAVGADAAELIRSARRQEDEDTGKDVRTSVHLVEPSTSRSHGNVQTHQEVEQNGTPPQQPHKHQCQEPDSSPLSSSWRPNPEAASFVPATTPTLLVPTSAHNSSYTSTLLLHPGLMTGTGVFPDHPTPAFG
ncbi:unnamed protein product, partial [Amoebophrya sp. A25]